MQSSHAAAAVSARFDDPNLVAYGGLAPVVRLAERCGLPALIDAHVRLPASKDGTGAFPAAKVMSLVGGMAAGADSIDDMDRLRHGGLPRLFAGVRAPSTLVLRRGSFADGHRLVDRAWCLILMIVVCWRRAYGRTPPRSVMPVGLA